MTTPPALALSSAPAASGARTPVRTVAVAVVGAGPKALFCVERLVSRALHARRAGHEPVPVRLVVLDPRPGGTGMAYAADQPARWRLNVSSEIVDTAWRTGDAPTPFPLASFDDWRESQIPADDEEGAHLGPDARAERFPPRSLVGRYLAECWAAVRDHLPPAWTLERHHEPVTDVVPASGATGAGSARSGHLVRTPAGDFTCEEVLLATGHGHDWPGALRHDPPTARLVGHVYPPDELDAIPAGASVVVRGAALTFIDVALALAPRGVRLVPFSRSGLFMMPKPDPAWVDALELDGRPLGECAERARADVFALAAHAGADPTRPRTNGPVDPAAGLRLAEAILERVAAFAAQSLAAARNREGTGDVTAARDADRALDLGRGLDLGVDLDAVLTARAAADPVDLLRHELAVAAGEAPPDATWAAGHAWQACYRALVATCSSETLGPAGWERFTKAAGGLEPIAFGPPLVNARALLALLDEGLVDATAMAARADLGAAVAHAREVAGPAGEVVVVDAVLAPAGVTEGLLRGLADAGRLTLGVGERGVLVDGELACLDAAGRRRPGLSAVGRPTEDVVLGNDTLNRALHDGPDRWARRILTNLDTER